MIKHKTSKKKSGEVKEENSAVTEKLDIPGMGNRSTSRNKHTSERPGKTKQAAAKKKPYSDRPDS